MAGCKPPERCKIDLSVTDVWDDYRQADLQVMARWLEPRTRWERLLNEDVEPKDLARVALWLVKAPGEAQPSRNFEDDGTGEFLAIGPEGTVVATGASRQEAKDRALSLRVLFAPLIVHRSSIGSRPWNE